MTQDAASPPPALAPRLGQVRVGLRDDLEVTRHLFRGEPSYVIRDPITFQTQRLEPVDYQIFVAIDASKPLAEIFQGLVERGQVGPDQEEDFYQFIMALHQRGFLHLPIADSKILFRRHQTRQRARRNEKLLGFLFLRIPLWCPDAFLEKTIRLARPLFSRTVLVLWLILMLAAGYVALRNRADLRQPLEGLLVARNLVLMWITLVALKVFHEFGHAYACKHYGGHVPEMGAYLILFTPCAYVDATASWGFTRKRERIIVCLAGMYVESFIAAAAVFVWAMTGPGLPHSLAYNVIFLAGVVTVLFNINPLMRYDGYYLMSDLTEVPNLRARSTRYVLDVLKRVLLGVPIKDRPPGRRLRCLLFSYGIAATIYRALLLLAIAAILAMKMFLLGLLLAAFFLGNTLYRSLTRLVQYLLRAEEVAPVRRRAIALGVLLLIVLPAGLLAIPLPAHVHARGVLATENETVVRAATGGFLIQAHAQRGQLVHPDDLLVELVDDSQYEAIAQAEAAGRAAEIRRDAYQIDEPDRALQEQERLSAHLAALAQARERLAELSPRAPIHGRVVTCFEDRDIGTFVEAGTPVARIASGQWQVRAILTEPDLLAALPASGDPVEFRTVGDAARTIQGKVLRVDPGGSRAVELSPLTQLGGGDVAVNPITGEATEPYFELVVDLDTRNDPRLRDGMTGVVRLEATAEPVARTTFRRLTRFINNLMKE